MQNRYTTVMVLLCLSVSGCLVSPQSPAESPTTEPTTMAVDYPDVPESDSNRSLLNFSKAYERALATERARNSTSGEIQAVTISINNATISERSANGTVVHLEYNVGLRVESNTGEVSSADTQYTVNYYVANDKEVHRASTKGLHRPGPNPRTNGTTVTAI